MTGAPASFAAANDAYSVPERFMKKFEKSNFPIIIPSGGIKISDVKEETIFEKAAPQMTPTDMSIMFPRRMNFFHSDNTLVYFLPIKI